jgi:hypothetical protein
VKGGDKVTEETRDIETGDNPDGQDLQARIAGLEEDILARDGQLANAIAKYRAAVVAGAPDVPEELVEGNSVEEVDRSLERARAIISKVRDQFQAEEAARSVPAGAPPRTPPDLSALTPGEKIAYALSKQLP